MASAGRVRSAVLGSTGWIALLVVLAGLAAFILAVVQAVRPSVYYKECPDDSDWFLGRPSAYAVGRCELRQRLDAAGSTFRDTPVAVSIVEDKGSISTTLRLRLPKNDSLVGIFRAGNVSAEPYTLATEVFGVGVSVPLTGWQPATVVVGDGASTADILLTHTEPAETVLSRRLHFDRPGSIEVTLATTQIRAARDVRDVTVQNATKLQGTAEPRKEVLIEFAPSPSITFSSANYANEPVATVLWQTFTGYVLPKTMAALPWLVLLFGLRPLNDKWRRLRCRSGGTRRDGDSGDTEFSRQRTANPASG